MGQNRRSPQKKKKKKNNESLKNLQLLRANLNPIPFSPHKTLDLSGHQNLLTRLGLWDFAHIEFDRDFPINADLLAQFIANFDRAKLCSHVNGAPITLGRAALARALKLPLENVFGSEEVLGLATEESIRFVEDFVFNWVILQGNGDMLNVPGEMLDLIKDIKDGNFEKLDWAGMIWFMLEKELVKGLELKNCFYAAHMMCLIKVQREDLLHLQGEEKEAAQASISERIEELQRQERLYKVRIEELQRDNHLMAKIVKGYRESLKQTQRAFDEYRGKCECKCKKLDEPIYKELDGSFGLVLSTKEIQERENKLDIGRKFDELRI